MSSLLEKYLSMYDEIQQTPPPRGREVTGTQTSTVEAVVEEAPDSPCWNCKGTSFFRPPTGTAWVCAKCHPPVNPTDDLVWHTVERSRDEKS